MKSCISYLQHILEETNFLLENSRGLTSDQFLANPVQLRAYVRSLEIIGEAVKNIPNEMKDKYPEIEWRKMAATRDRLIHGYFSVDFDLVWDIVQNKIPGLDADIKKILDLEGL